MLLAILSSFLSRFLLRYLSRCVWYAFDASRAYFHVGIARGKTKQLTNARSYMCSWQIARFKDVRVEMGVYKEYYTLIKWSNTKI